MIVLVDTSIWRRHLRTRDLQLERLLAERRVVTHDCVLHELILGGLGERTRRALIALRRLRWATAEEIAATIHRNRLAQTGVGAVDAHLFHAALDASSALYTADVALAGTFAPYQPREWIDQP